MFTPGVAKRAVLAETARSQAATSWQPEAVAVACTRAITGLGLKDAKDLADTMKKAFAWLDKHKVEYSFHDYKKAGIDRARLEKWVSHAGWEAVLNRAGTTFKKLPDADKENVTEKKAIALMLAQPSMIKRPVVEKGGKLLVGFKPEIYQSLLS